MAAPNFFDRVSLQHQSQQPNRPANITASQPSDIEIVTDLFLTFRDNFRVDPSQDALWKLVREFEEASREKSDKSIVLGCQSFAHVVVSTDPSSEAEAGAIKDLLCAIQKARIEARVDGAVEPMGLLAVDGQ